MASTGKKAATAPLNPSETATPNQSASSASASTKKKRNKKKTKKTNQTAGVVSTEDTILSPDVETPPELPQISEIVDPPAPESTQRQSAPDTATAKEAEPKVGESQVKKSKNKKRNKAHKASQETPAAAPCKSEENVSHPEEKREDFTRAGEPLQQEGKSDDGHGHPTEGLNTEGPNQVPTEAVGTNETHDSGLEVVENIENVTDAGAPDLSELIGLKFVIRKEDNLSEWYSEVITKAEMIEYYDVSGCYILRPWAFAIWKHVQTFIDREIAEMGVENAYFPLFVSKSALEKEKTHAKDFEPEVAWVTRSGKAELAEPIAVRPTSETIIYPSYARWIQSYRDLPLRLNQWSNAIRWEFKQPQPFLRTREFLWQEGHTAFATKEEAENEAHAILNLYARVYEELLAIPVVRGRKTAYTTFPGAEWSEAVFTYLGSEGHAVQGASSHHLGQNFSRLFDISFEHPVSGEKTFVEQNSWGVTTRVIGLLVMVHGDDKGLVLPPRAAKVQVMIIPTSDGTEKAELAAKCRRLAADLCAAELRAECDLREHYSPAWKFRYWEVKGVPLCVAVGAGEELEVTARDTGEKLILTTTEEPESSSVGTRISTLLEEVHARMYRRAKAEMDANMVVVEDWTAFRTEFGMKKLVLSPFCGRAACAGEISVASQDNGATSGAKCLCIPLSRPPHIKPQTRCINPTCGQVTTHVGMFGRSYSC